MPGVGFPVRITCSPSAKRRGRPNRAMRATSSGTSTGNICASRASRVRETGSRTSRLADVLLHHVGVPRVRLRGVAAELAQRPALPQQVPALVELGLHRGKASALFGAELAALEEPVLFAHQ